MLKHTRELVAGETVATRKIGKQFAAPAGPGQRGAKRTIEKIEPAPDGNDTLVITFTDGLVAAQPVETYWHD